MLKDRIITLFLTAYLFFQIDLLMGVMQFGHNTMRAMSALNEQEFTFWFSGIINYFPVIRIIIGASLIVLATLLAIKRPSFFREKNLLVWISAALLVLTIASGYIYFKSIEPMQKMNLLLN